MMKYLTEFVIMSVLSMAAGALAYVGVVNDDYATVITACGSVVAVLWLLVDKALDDLNENQTHSKQ